MHEWHHGVSHSKRGCGDMNNLHIVSELSEANGMYQVARMLAREQGGEVETAETFLSMANGELCRYDEVWVHGLWLPCLWKSCWKVLRLGGMEDRPKLVRMTHGSLSPICLRQHGKWKKRLVSPIEKWLFRLCDSIVVTGEWEKQWAERYLGDNRKASVNSKIEVTDLKRFFNLDGKLGVNTSLTTNHSGLHILYLGRRHPLKGVEYLEQAVKNINALHQHEARCPIELKVESETFGEEKNRLWNWCDVLVLPTMSENFGLSIAEALEHGKSVITTDGAPAWKNDERVVWLNGFVEADRDEKIQKLVDAIVSFRRGEWL